VNDRELVADHLRWLDVLLTGRTGSAAGVRSVLEFLGGELHDFPIAQDCIAHGQEVLDLAEAER
jgi:hypothetical protein